MISIDKKVMMLLVRLILGTGLATGALYSWSLICRQLLPLNVVSHVYDEESIVHFLQDSFPKSGTYTIPTTNDDEDDVKALLEIGPVATLHILSPNDTHFKARAGKVQIFQIALTAFCIGLILKFTRQGLDSYRARVALVALAGITAAIYNDLADPVWTYHPWQWSLAKAVYHLTSWTIAGLILGNDWFINTRDTFTFRDRKVQVKENHLTSTDPLSLPPQ